MPRALELGCSQGCCVRAWWVLADDFSQNPPRSSQGLFTCLASMLSETWGEGLGGRGSHGGWGLVSPGGSGV